jgi:hypothetical protein
MKFNKEHTVFVAYNNKDRKFFSKELEEFFFDLVQSEVISTKAAFNEKYEL